jgi:hypothetical protein
MVVYSLIFSTIIAMTLSAVLLMAFGKKKKEICFPIQMKIVFKPT